MIRSALIKDQPAFDAEGFRLRGTEVTRLEGLTDGVFALAMTLLIVSVDVPGSFSEMLEVIKGLPVFAVCFAVLMWFWAEHFQFMRRYGLEDQAVIVLNSVLLFVVLFYVYPLKFLFTLVIKGMLYGNQHTSGGVPMITNQQVPMLFLLYGLGAGSVALVFLLMHAHALRRSADLALTPQEAILTKGEMVKCVGQMGVAALSVALAYTLPPQMMWLPGVIYSMTGVTEGTVGWYFGKKVGALQRAYAPEPVGAASD